MRGTAEYRWRDSASRRNQRWLAAGLGTGGILVFIHQVAIWEFETPVFTSGTEPFQANLILTGSGERFYPNDAELNPALPILESEFVAGFQRVVNGSQASAI